MLFWEKSGLFLAPVFYKLLYMSLTAMVIGLMVVLARRFWDFKIPPFWKYMMWLPVLAALLIPFRPQSPTAVLSNVERVQEISFRREELALRMELLELKTEFTEFPDKYNETEHNALKAQVEKLHIKSLIFDIALPLIWLSGFIFSVFFFILAGIRLKFKLKASRIDSDLTGYYSLLDSCRDSLHVKFRPRIILQDYLASPALFGFPPKIVLPECVREMDEKELSYILLHELSHCRRFDMLTNHLLAALSAVYWFNPLIRPLFKFIRQDMELANDASVLKSVGDDRRVEYGLSLLSVLSRSCGVKASACPLVCMTDSAQNMKRRLKMIKLGNFSKRQRIAAAVISLALILVGGGLFLTSALALKEPEKNPEITRQTPFTNPLAESIPTPSEKDMEIILKNLEIIESSPAISSRPGDYIEAHRKEYDEIVNMGDGALMELFIMFEKGGETGLRGHIMAALCQDIIGSSYTSDKLAETGQKWYDNYRDDMLPLRGTEKYPEKHKLILYSVVDSYGYTKIPNFSYPGDDPLLKLVYQTLTDDAIKIKMKSREADFLVVAPHIFKSVEEDGQLKVFVTAYISAYGLLDWRLEEGAGSIVPYAITYEKNSSGEYILLKTEPSGDGSLWAESIRKFCTYPVSGKKILGLADEIIGHYSDYSDIIDLQQANLKACLRASGITGTVFDEKGNVKFVI